MNLTKEQLDYRDNVLFGAPYEELRYKSGGTSFFKAKPNEIQNLVDLHLIDPEECQNDSPTISEFLEYTENHPDGNFDLHGYAVSQTRPDARVTIDAISITGPRKISSEMAGFIEMYHWADEMTVRNDWDNITIKAWWD